MKINRSAWSAFQRGATSAQLKEAAKDKADNFLFWLAISLGVFYFLAWQWALLPALLAGLNGARSFDASRLIPDMEVLEGLFRHTSSH